MTHWNTLLATFDPFVLFQIELYNDSTYEPLLRKHNLNRPFISKWVKIVTHKP